MTLRKFAHIVKEIDGVDVRVVEAGITKERAQFLADLLGYNKVETKIFEDPPKEDEPQTYSIGTLDVTFNPIVKVYNRELLTPGGNKITPDYWDQKTEETDPNYWDRNKKNWL